MSGGVQGTQAFTSFWREMRSDSEVYDCWICRAWPNSPDVHICQYAWLPKLDLLDGKPLTDQEKAVIRAMRATP